MSGSGTGHQLLTGVPLWSRYTTVNEIDTAELREQAKEIQRQKQQVAQQLQQTKGQGQDQQDETMQTRGMFR